MGERERGTTEWERKKEKVMGKQCQREIVVEFERGRGWNWEREREKKGGVARGWKEMENFNEKEFGERNGIRFRGQRGIERDDTGEGEREGWRIKLILWMKRDWIRQRG